MISPHECAPRRTSIEAVASLTVLPFASCFAYSPGGSGALCDQARALCSHLKAADPVWLPRLIARIWLERAGRGRFPAIFGPGVVLVPVPGSAPRQGAAWVGERLARCLLEVGLASEVWAVLQRRSAVRKSAFAPTGERPSVIEHYASFAIEHEPCRERLRLTLVDDVITRGRTLLAAAVRLRETFPAAEIRAFALLRTLGRDESLLGLADPCEGEVRWLSGDARRVP